MADRAHLSIGEVLSLLREEFPDITISKIRFLESQGLLDPERTPSGYRKFYDDDVERLRWILRQQREHFLPLKVIKGRLSGAEPAAEVAPDPPVDVPASHASSTQEPSPAGAGRAGPGGAGPAPGRRPAVGPRSGRAGPGRSRPGCSGPGRGQQHRRPDRPPPVGGGRHALRRPGR